SFACTAKDPSGQRLMAQANNMTIQQLIDQGLCMFWVSDAPFPLAVEVMQYTKAKVVTPGWTLWAATTSDAGSGFDDWQTAIVPADDTGWATSRFGFWGVVKDGDPITEPTEVEFEFDATNLGLQMPHGTCLAIPGQSTFHMPPINPVGT